MKYFSGRFVILACCTCGISEGCSSRISIVAVVSLAEKAVACLLDRHFPLIGLGR